MNVALIGGDERAIEAGRELMRRGNVCRFYALEELPAGRCEGLGMLCSEPYLLYEALKDADALLLPLPLSRDGRTLNASFSSKEIALSDLLAFLPLLRGRQSASEKVLLFGGGFPDDFIQKADGRVIDLLKNEEFALKNALPTAEGAIGLALLHFSDLLEGARCLVIGFGRIGSLLTKKLLALGASVSVLARRAESRALAQRDGASAFSFEDAKTALSGAQIVFNTVPAPVFDDDALLTLQKDALYIELASSPGGLTEGQKTALKCPFLSGAGLPGKFSPRFSGRLIARLMLEEIGKDQDKDENGKDDLMKTEKGREKNRIC